MNKQIEDIAKIERYIQKSDFVNDCMNKIEHLETEIIKINDREKKHTGKEIICVMSHRIKTAQSIYNKLIKKGYIPVKKNIIKLKDIIGIRVVCSSLEDVYRLSDEIKNIEDIIILKEKDYIKKPKKSGYKSLHLIVRMPYYKKKSCVEIQIRTAAMDYFAIIDHDTRYKKKYKV